MNEEIRTAMKAWLGRDYMHLSLYDALEKFRGRIDNMVCQNCQYWDKVEQQYDPRQYGDCQRHVQCTPSHLTVEDFGCNKFKERQ